MDISNLFVSQRNLRRAWQLPALVESILDGDLLTPIRLSEADDETVQVEDGHHRLVAYWLAGRRRLKSHEYVLFVADRPRFRRGRFPDLLTRLRVPAEWDPQAPE